jgi:signal transduction histidine kinase/ActR/RegA family two-component response regulator
VPRSGTTCSPTDANRQAGFLLFFPVYRAARGRDVFVGWTHAAFRADDLFRALVAEEPDPLVDFQVYDGPRALKDTLLHDREVEPQPGAAQETDQIQFGGRVWTLVFTALPRLEAGSFGPAAGTLLAGVVISALLFALTSLEARARSRAEELVQELQRTVDENARLLRDLQEVDRRKDQFLAVLGHELRNPLAPVVTALEVLRRDPGAAERQLPVVERQTRHMVRIVDDLLDVSRISRGKIELRKQSLSVRDALTRAFEAVAPEARSRDQKLILSLPEEPLRIDADPVRLEQILGNLLTNAIKYTPPGGEVELAAREQSGALVVQVRDTGIGVPLEAQQTLFEPFVQVAGAKDYAKGGLGIGLALVKALVQLHGGSVSIASEGPGRGTTFTVSVPGVVRGETPPEVRPIAAAVRRGRVLVVDDNVDAAVTLADAVSMDGHEVRVAHEGEGALEMARAFSPDVVLLDIGLPGMDGYEVARKMRQMEQTREAFIVALTGFGQRSDRDRALREGFDEHLVKPAELDSVQAVLRRRLGPIQVEAVPAASDRSEPRAR